jgi:dolichol-phosphate mannosyltransferase
MPPQAKVLVVIPTYNEAGNLRALVAAIHEALPQATVLIVDDASPDGTGQLADALAARYPWLEVLHRPGKQGLATAYVAGFGYALERDYDRVFAMDADLSHDPRYLALLFAAADESDLVIGSRYVPGGQTPDWGLSRRLISGCGNVLARTLLRLPVRDCTAGFKCYRRCVLEALALEAIHLEGYAFQIETVYQSYRKGFRIKEVPIVFRDRMVGRSKMSTAIVAEALTYVLGQVGAAAWESGRAHLARRGDGRASARAALWGWRTRFWMDRALPGSRRVRVDRRRGETMRCPQCGAETPEEEWNCVSCRINLYWAQQHFAELAQLREHQGLQTRASTPAFLLRSHQREMDERARRGGMLANKVRLIARRVMREQAMEQP